MDGRRYLAAALSLMAVSYTHLFKSLVELGETVSLALDLMPGESSQKDTINGLVKGLKQLEDMDLEKMMQLVSLFSAMNQDDG